MESSSLPLEYSLFYNTSHSQHGFFDYGLYRATFLSLASLAPGHLMRRDFRKITALLALCDGYEERTTASKCR